MGQVLLCGRNNNPYVPFNNPCNDRNYQFSYSPLQANFFLLGDTSFRVDRYNGSITTNDDITYGLGYRFTLTIVTTFDGVSYSVKVYVDVSLKNLKTPRVVAGLGQVGWSVNSAGSNEDNQIVIIRNIYSYDLDTNQKYNYEINYRIVNLTFYEAEIEDSDKKLLYLFVERIKLLIKIDKLAGMMYMINSTSLVFPPGRNHIIKFSIELSNPNTSPHLSSIFTLDVHLVTFQGDSSSNFRNHICIRILFLTRSFPSFCD